ncbi:MULTISPECIES: hypothetical protein [Niastella]|uniref:Lipoprotein n=1 Tax=Niastella soli TaxID=2821487 RepID=A0ABS3Z432_9BACT|nr:hypothetical protein [Niastella soli]MBO9204918.1 hypothetical protein [Niastella soli]
MKKMITAGMLVILFACSSQPRTDSNAATPKVVTDTNVSKPLVAAASDSIAQPEELKGKSRLQQLSERNVFSTIQAKILPTLPEKHQKVLGGDPDLNVLAFATGDLFQNNKNDYAFIVYDKKHQVISILLYDELADSYRQLYESLKVNDEINKLDCNNDCGRLDENLASEIADQADSYIKDPVSFIANKQIKISDLTKDEDILIKDGCLSKNANNANIKNGLCIATSFVYNNWKCLRYDKAKDAFTIFFSQTFAD